MYLPDTAFIVLTTGCNRRDECVHCFYNVEPDRICPVQPETADVVELLRKLRLSGLTSVIFTGGEPLLRPDLPKLIAAASSMSLHVLLLTNGLLLNAQLAASLAEAGTGAVAMSLLALGKEEKEAALLLTSAGIRTSFIFCITKQNYETIPEAIRFARNFNSAIIFQPAYIPRGHALQETHSLKTIGQFDWSRIYMLLRPWAKESGAGDYLKLIYGYYNEPDARPARCSLSGHALVVDADMQMYPCFHRRDLACGPAAGNGFSFAMAELQKAYRHTADAGCFGEHCISLHTG